jgi:flagellar hook-associated protein 1
MPGLTDILHTARDALTAQSYGLGVAGQNISNVNTPGYVRRRANLESMPLGSQSFGTVVAKGLTRVTDQYIEQRHYASLGMSASAEQSDGLLGQVEALFDIQSSQNIGNSLSELYAAFSELTTDPSNTALRNQVLNNAESFASKVASNAQALADFRVDLTKEASATAGSINELARSISEVSKKIAAADAGGFDAADLKDQRDSLLLDLSELVDVRTFTNGQGQLVVQAASTTLVEGEEYRTMEVGLDPSGAIQVFAKSSTGSRVDISSYVAGGKLAGIKQVHDVDTTEVQRQLDTFAFDVATAINAQHQAGFGSNGETGNPLFDVAGSSTNAAQSLRLSTAMTNRPDRVAASATSTGLPGDTDNALAMSQLADLRFANSGTQTGAESFGAILADVGNRKQAAEFDSQVRRAMTDQTFAMRESVSGVNLDEEMISLTKFQRAYEAAARVLTTADELLEGLINSLGR